MFKVLIRSGLSTGEDVERFFCFGALQNLPNKFRAEQEREKFCLGLLRGVRGHAPPEKFENGTFQIG